MADGKNMGGLVGPDSVMNLATLAKVLGKVEEDLVLPGGKKVRTIAWKGDDLRAINTLLHNQSANLPALVTFDGPMPAWLLAALVHEVHPMTAAVNSQQGFITIGCQLPSGNGSGVNKWEITQKGEWTQVEFTVEGNMDPKQLINVVPPRLPMGSKVIVSGRGPIWLAAAVAMAYHGIAKAVACLQPKVGATVCITHVQEVTLGSLIPE
jgi:CRISPR-associated Csx3 family protein